MRNNTLLALYAFEGFAPELPLLKYANDLNRNRFASILQGIVLKAYKLITLLVIGIALTFPTLT